MSSRGFFVGQVVDDLDAIASQVHQRCALGQFDLNRVLEDFFKEVLNLTYGWNLSNLNSKRSNEPSIDLGDKAAKIAVQVTSRTDAKKINTTVDKLISNFPGEYQCVYILMIGERKKKYKLNAQTLKFGFNVDEHIIDMTALCRQIISLELPKLQSVQRKIADEQARVRIELEPRLPSGGYSTSVTDFIEPRPDVMRSDASIFATHAEVEGLFEVDVAEVMLNEFIDELALLPRLTREFYGWMIDNSDHHLRPKSDKHHINVDIVKNRAASVPSVEAELRVLNTYNFIDYDEPDDNNRSGHWRLLFPGPKHGSCFGEGFMNFTCAERLSCSTMFQNMDFRVFGPPPTTTGKVATKKKRRAT
ncbi:SMEK domain-containing protein [Hoeflea sp. AS16]|uniref:SMEK domain-containing protein n=1 Tax=Hoeflea sp. AS16 TaxID=3135779 RepID=UPI00317C2411